MGVVSQLYEIRTDNQDLMSLQDSVKSVLKEIASNPFLRGNLIRDIEMVSGSTSIVPHKLNWRPTGYLITRNQGNAVIWDTQKENPYPELSVYLNSSANTTIDVWFF